MACGSCPFILVFPVVLSCLFACSEKAGPAIPAVPTFEKEVIHPDFIAEGLAVADVDRDGDLDILSGYHWFEAPDWSEHAIRPPRSYDFATDYSETFLNFSMDVNQDGWEDLIRFDTPGTGVYWYENPRGEDILWPEHLIDSVASNESPMAADLDADGRPELVFANHHRDEMMWFRTEKQADRFSWKGRAIGLPRKEGTRQYSHGLGWGDVNGDGIKDIIIREGWWEATSDPGQMPWTFHRADLGEPCSQMYAFDFDGDGDQDVLSASAHQYGIWWHEQVVDGDSASFKRHLIDSTFSQSHAVAFRDLNGDELPDFVTGKRFYAHNGKDPGGKDAAVLYWFELNRDDDGTPSWTKHLIDEDSGVGEQVLVEDIDRNGIPDILNSNKKGLIIFWGK